MEILKHIPNRETARGVVTYDAQDLPETQFVQSHVNLNKPCLIKGAVKSWRATQLWRDPDYLSGLVDNPEVRVYGHSNYLDWKSMARNEERATFRQALKRIEANEEGIVSIPSIFCVPDSPFYPLRQDIGVFAFLTQKKAPVFYPQRRFFMYSGAGTAWHYHQIDETLMCQIKGSKRVGLLSPDCAGFKQLNDDLMAYKYLDGPGCFASYKDEIQPFEVVVEEGDSLYIPPFWWHGVEPVDKELGITMAECWASPEYKLADFKKPVLKKLWKEAFSDFGIAKLIMRHGLPAIMSRFKNKELVLKMD
ncbi:cupin-like domain-containing protein [Microbulbifer sp. ANSA003]|uniref:cupin-like domain-containing protein n=1 Tax=Microbulbifer sp. ANSA003 TaxID=3243360 RepID=UPI0040428CD0